jgi:hypothetical protein
VREGDEVSDMRRPRFEPGERLKNFTVRLPKDLREWLETEATRQMRPTSNLIAWILDKYRVEKESKTEA